MQDEKCQSPKLPDDTIVRELESRKLWRRAACCCRRILLMTKAPIIAERIVQRIAWCHQQVRTKYPGALVLPDKDLRHIDNIAHVPGCGPVVRHWII